MIPKTIHYCWFGRGPKPRLAEKCIASWKKHCPDYEIIEWNEDNYDVTKNPYMAAAYQEKKWGFVPDYARLDIIYNHGGIYLDTDVEIVRSMDDLLDNEAFAGIEYGETYTSGAYIALGLGFGAEKHSQAIKAFLDSYENLSFYHEDGSLNLTPSPVINLACAEKMGFDRSNTLQRLEHLTIYPSEYFCPLDNISGELKRSKNTHTIHWFAASWAPKEVLESRQRMRERMRQKKRRLHRREIAREVLGDRVFEMLKSMKKRFRKG